MSHSLLPCSRWPTPGTLPWGLLRRIDTDVRSILCVCGLVGCLKSVPLVRSPVDHWVDSVLFPVRGLCQSYPYECHGSYTVLCGHGHSFPLVGVHSWSRQLDNGDLGLNSVDSRTELCTPVCFDFPCELEGRRLLRGKGGMVSSKRGGGYGQGPSCKWLEGTVH